MIKRRMKTTLIHKLKIGSSFALLGSVVAGTIFGNHEYADSIRTIAAISSIGIAKATNFV